MLPLQMNILKTHIAKTVVVTDSKTAYQYQHFVF